MARPERTDPLASFVVAVALVVSPSSIEDFASTTSTLATGTGPVPPPPPPPPPQATAAREQTAAALTARWNGATRATQNRATYVTARITPGEEGARKEGNANIGQMFTMSRRTLADDAGLALSGLPATTAMVEQLTTLPPATRWSLSAIR